MFLLSRTFFFVESTSSFDSIGNEFALKEQEKNWPLALWNDFLGVAQSTTRVKLIASGKRGLWKSEELADQTNISSLPKATHSCLQARPKVIIAFDSRKCRPYQLKRIRMKHWVRELRNFIVLVNKHLIFECTSSKRNQQSNYNFTEPMLSISKINS